MRRESNFKRNFECCKHFLVKRVYGGTLKPMRTRIGIMVAYLLLGCILLEDALPCFAKSNLMEMCESKTEKSEKETKSEKEIKDELSEAKERFHSTNLRISSFLIHPGSIFTDSEEIPDSAHRSIFSPPPERV